MILNDLLVWSVVGAFGVLAVLACFDLLRHREQLRLDLALLFGSLALTVMSLARPGTSQPYWLGLLSSAAIVAEPFLLLRLLRYFNPIPTLVQRAALAGMLLAWLLLLVVPPGLTPLVHGVAVVYFILVQGYASLTLIRSGQAARGITRWRLNSAAVGSGLLGLALWLASLSFIIGLPSLTNVLEPIGLLMLLICAALYYIAFNPPDFMRQAWQHIQLLNFLEEASALPARKRARGMLDLLCATALGTTGGVASAAALWSDEHHRLFLLPQADFLALVGSLDIYEGITADAWSSGAAVVADRPEQYGADCARLAAAVEATVIIAVPISAPDHIFGLLLVFHQRRSLFIQTDIGLLTMLAQQTAMSLEYEAVLIEQDGFIEALERTASRNKALDTLSQSLAEQSFDRRAILDSLVVQVARSLGDGAIVHLAAPDGTGWKAEVTHYPKFDVGPDLITEPGAYNLDCSHWPGEQVVRSGQPVLIADATLNRAGRRDEQTKTDRAPALPVHSLVSVPLKIKGEVIGTLTAWRDGPGRPYADDDRVFLQIVADRAAVALDNADLTRDLEERVVIRTFELETANRDLRAFAHTVAHEVKNPLSLISGYAQMVLMEHSPVLNETARHSLNMIVQGAEKMNGIITSLLLLANIREHHVALEPLTMQVIMEEACQRLMPQIRATNAKIAFASDWPQVLGYPAWIEEVWVNYMSNALKYGGQSPHLELGWKAEAAGMVRFWVQDNGPGIPSVQQQRLFTPFVRLNPASVEGHGLGLSIVRRIVEKCGGEVGVESEGVPGKGTIFWFTLKQAVP